MEKRELECPSKGDQEVRKDWRRPSMGVGKVCKNRAMLEGRKENGRRVKGHRLVTSDDRSSIPNSRVVSEPPGSWPALCPARSGKRLAGASHAPCVLVEAKYSLGIFLLPY